MAKTVNLEHAANCYLLTGGAPVEPCCTCGAQEALDEIDRLRTKLNNKNKEIARLTKLVEIDEKMEKGCWEIA